MIKTCEHPDTSSDSYSKQLKWILVREAEHILPESARRSGGVDRARALAAAGSPGVRSARSAQLGHNKSSMPKIRMHSIVTDEETNTILVSGPPDKVALAKKTLTDIDVQRDANDKPRLIGGKMLKLYNVASNAVEMAKSLQDPKWGTSVSITAAGTNSIIVVAHPEDQIKIGQMIVGAPG